MMRMVERVCPICRTNAAASVFAEANIDAAKLNEFAFASRKVPEYMHHRLMHCSTCDLLFVNPVPLAEELGDAYRDAAFDSGEEAGFAARTYGQLIDGVSLPDKNGALDIGTGDGVFLKELLARGFTNVIGVEPSTAPIAAADPNIRPLIHHGLFGADAAPPLSLSLVSCLQTIEHVPDPLATCRDSLSLLKPGGVLFIACHNRRSMTNRLLGKRSPIFDVEHMQLFSPHSARALLEAAGFTKVIVRTYMNHYPLHYWLKLVPIPTAAKPMLIGASKKLGIGRLAMPMPAGNMAVYGWRS
ncbi:MAG: class I SAM-dependent methyltransferase [Phycisphaerae bacterium]|nr:class I SAM-dependent methyltransferase [Phycisphaerae bacterium]